jgi:hypothetical protein
MARNDQPRSFQSWTTIDATPNDFLLDAGWYGLTLVAVAWGTATLKRLIPGTTTYVTVATAVAADGYATVQLPAGQYQLTLAGITDLSGMIELITPGRR